MIRSVETCVCVFMHSEEEKHELFKVWKSLCLCIWRKKHTNYWKFGKVSVYAFGESKTRTIRSFGKVNVARTYKTTQVL